MNHLYHSMPSRFSYLAFFKMTAILLLCNPFSFINAQSPIAVLENADGDTVLSSYSDGALLLPGELGTGNIPVEGPGVRMMWYPAKAAFRAGGVASDQWSNDYIGEYSSAFGLSTTASGDYSTAFGDGTTATGDYSTAFGKFSIASEILSTAFGSNTKATGYNSTAFGNQTTASGFYTTAFGYETEASGINSTAFGYETKATGVYSTAFGFITMASGNHSTAFGDGTTASGDYSTAFGKFSIASEILSTAFGSNTKATGYNSTAFGNQTTASGFNTTAFGYETKASGQYSTAFGYETKATGVYSTAFGRSTIASTAYSLSIGRYNDSNQTDDGTLFVIGNGGDDTDRSDAFRVNNSGQAFAGMVMLNSDRRLKENIEHLDPNTLDKLTKISAVRYRFKDQQTKPQGDQIGLIAQEVQMHFPELVTEGNDGYLSVSYNNFTAVLLKGLQEQQKQLEEKDRQILELQKKMLQLDERMAQLEQRDIVPQQQSE